FIRVTFSCTLLKTPKPSLNKKNLRTEPIHQWKLPCEGGFYGHISKRLRPKAYISIHIQMAKQSVRQSNMKMSHFHKTHTHTDTQTHTHTHTHAPHCRHHTCPIGST